MGVNPWPQKGKFRPVILVGETPIGLFKMMILYNQQPMKGFHQRTLSFTAYQIISNSLPGGACGGSADLCSPLFFCSPSHTSPLAHPWLSPSSVTGHTFSSLCLCTWSSSAWRSPFSATQSLHYQIQISMLPIPPEVRALLICLKGHLDLPL